MYTTTLTQRIRVYTCQYSVIRKFYKLSHELCVNHIVYVIIDKFGYVVLFDDMTYFLTS